MQAWSEEDSLNAQRQLIIGGVFHSIGQNCVSVAILILCASYLGVPEYVSACFGSIGYFAYLTLPVGYKVCAHFGVCRGAFLLRGSTCAGYLLYILAVLKPSIGVWLFPFAVVLASSLICASTAMGFPLQKTITNDKTIGPFLSKSSTCGYVTALVASTVVAWCIKHFGAGANTFVCLFALAAFFVLLGAVCYLTFREPRELQEEAMRPLFRQLPELMRYSGFVKLCLAGMFANVLLMVMPSACILAARSGCGAGDSLVVILATSQTLAAIATAISYKWFVSKLGPSRLLLSCTPLMLLVIFFWAVVPVDIPKAFLFIPFVLCGIILVFVGTSFSQYITVMVPSHLQIPGSLGVLMTHGTLAGLIGLVVNSTLFKILWMLPETSPLTHYRQFFLCCLFFCALSTSIIYKMPRY